MQIADDNKKKTKNSIKQYFFQFTSELILISEISLDSQTSKLFPSSSSLKYLLKEQ